MSQHDISSVDESGEDVNEPVTINQKDPFSGSGDGSGSGHEHKVVRAWEYADLTAALADNPGNVHLRIPDGVTTFSEAIDRQADVIIEGTGEGSVLQSDGYHRLTGMYEDAPESSVVFRNLTVDMNQVESAGRVFNIGANRRKLILENVEVKNINLANQTSQEASIFVPGNLAYAKIEDCIFHFDTLTNRNPNKYMVMKTQSDGLVGKLTARDNIHYGEITLDRSTKELLNGYSVSVGNKAHIDSCEFYDWDQYATFVRATANNSHVTVTDNYAENNGNGDQFRAGVGSSTYNGTITMTGNVYEGAADTADRAMIVQSGRQPRRVTITDNKVRGSHVGIEVTSARELIMTENHVVDVGSLSGEARWGIQVRDRDGPVEDAKIANNVISNTTGDRTMDYGIILQDQNGNWGGVTTVNDNIIRGAATSDVQNEVTSSTPNIRNND